MNNIPSHPFSLQADRLEIVDTAERLDALAPAWDALWQRADGLIFQSHAWISTWWHTEEDANQRTLRIGLVWQGEMLVAVMPLAISRRKGLRFLEWAAVAYSDYGDVLMAPECSKAALEALWVQICRLGGFDLAFISRLTPEAAARGLFEAQIPGGVRLQPNHRSEVSHRVTGPWESGEAWYATLSKKMRKTYRHGRNTIEKAGSLRFRVLGLDEPLEPVLRQFAAFKSRRLEERDLSSRLFEGDGPMLAALVGVLARAGILRLCVLECDDTIVAFSVNFVQRGTMMAWVTTFDPRFGEASPGLLLLIDYIKWSFDHGLHTVDFLCGGEAFKERFATESVVLEILVGARTSRGSLGLVVDQARRHIRAATSEG